ncbi:MAG TPA: hypothetical protein VJP78_14925 [Thermoleophilia bacterium]|nr:hypothetical protein [Thermoleophilia bacterium]
MPGRCVGAGGSGEATWNLEQQRVFGPYGDSTEVERFVDAWATLETLRPPSNPVTPHGIIEVHVSLKGGRHWTLEWHPTYGEAVFRLTGSGGPDMDPKSSMKVHSDEMLRLLQQWAES